MFTLFLAPRDEFVLHKLKKEAEEGAFIVRWSVLDYHRIILASLSRTKVILMIILLRMAELKNCEMIA